MTKEFKEGQQALFFLRFVKPDLKECYRFEKTFYGMKRLGARGMIEIKRFIANEDGATAIEYALIASLISIFIVGALLAFQEQVAHMFNYIAEHLDPALRGEHQ